MDLDWLREQLTRPGYTQAGLARHIGLDPPTVSKIVAGKRRLLAAEIPKIIEFFKATPPGMPPEVVPAMQGVRPLANGTELPVYSSAEGGLAGAMVINNDPADYVKRPEPLYNVRRAFAVYVINDSMSPAYEHGDMILINPSKPVRGDDDCLFVRTHQDGGMDALIKRLIRSEQTKWRVKQFNPVKEFDLEKQLWPQAMFIAGRYNRR